ncbi:MAG: hypothetical protein D3907_03845 [Candidatus Electrothrix sp. AUS3]|nr:hypothetical protein [Candidatus Electrothrix gigas]
MPLILDELLGRRDSIFVPFLYENTNKFDMSTVQRKVLRYCNREEIKTETGEGRNQKEYAERRLKLGIKRSYWKYLIIFKSI